MDTVNTLFVMFVLATAFGCKGKPALVGPDAVRDDVVGSMDGRAPPTTADSEAIDCALKFANEKHLLERGATAVVTYATRFRSVYFQNPSGADERGGGIEIVIDAERCEFVRVLYGQ